MHAAPASIPRAAICAGIRTVTRTATRTTRGTALALVLAGLSGSLLAAGQVEISFIQPTQYTDAGQGSFDRERHLASLAAHLHQLGRQLPDGQTLKLDVLDVDLAGEIWPASFNNVRVLRGRVDWPQITLRYTLADGTREISRGEERLSDPAYLSMRRAGLNHGDLPYEKRLLDHWFRERLQPVAPASH